MGWSAVLLKGHMLKRLGNRLCVRCPSSPAFTMTDEETNAFDMMYAMDASDEAKLEFLRRLEYKYNGK